MDEVRPQVRYSDQGGPMSTREREKEQAVETCSTGSCSTEKSKEQAQAQIQAEKKELKVEQPATKSHGSCCG